MNAEHQPYTLIGPDRKPYKSSTPGTFGGYRKNKIYGRMDCRAALRAIEKGGYINEYFLLMNKQAIAAGYRPCGVCLREKYVIWKENRNSNEEGI